ncbi:GNAT family N-acetyltransferase [Pseudomonas sp. CAN2814]|uniref:GNAT family N-acetyltransferase n=1 Tax=Pseudomonas sp. CAN1 TaxID=3046726 RepID=UPI0026497A54|nr:GNAT family N-acetyltransferase [Pseudomonas sp. CAN1]MDN6856731.1 GNAT family N-acetyltransferase [Pseudomonas sp. CAN1]
MTTPPLIRCAESADTDAILRILSETYEATWKPALCAEAVARFESSARTSAYVRERLAHFAIACIAGEVVGLLDWRDDFIDALHVSPRHQRLGIGAALLHHAEAAIVREGYACVRLETDTFNHQSRAFYGKHGYAEADFYPDEEWHSGFTTVLMSKAL